MQQVGKICFVVSCLVPQIGWGVLWISEIHYNPDGSDSGYEWIEVWNESDEEVDITNYKFRENEVNHGLYEYQQDPVIGEHEYAVVADNPAYFLETYPDYSGVIIDSAFSLSNSGELLEITDSSGNLYFSVTYDSATGGDGNGASIGLIGDVWQEVAASPGSSNSVFVADATNTDTTNETNESETSNSGDTVAVDFSPATYIEIKNPDYAEKTIKVDAGEDRVVMAGVAYWFTGTVYGLQGGEIDDPEIRWNWGDGTTGSGRQEMHTYRYPGTYTLSMSGKVAGYSDRDRALVTVIEPSLVLGIETHNDHHAVAIQNTSPYHLELSGYRLDQGEHRFTFPEDTFAAPGQALIIDEHALGFSVNLEEKMFFRDGVQVTIDSLLPGQVVLARDIQEKQKEQEQSTAEKTEASQTADTGNSSEVSAGTHSVVYRGTESSPSPNPAGEDLLAEHTFAPGVFSPEFSQEASIIQSQATVPWHWIITALTVLGMFSLYVYALGRARTDDDPETDVHRATSHITLHD